jgi:zinc protease
MKSSRIHALLLAVLLAACGGAHKATAPVGAEAKPLARERLVVQPSQAPVLELRVMFEAGSVDDPAGKEGLTHVTVLSMLEGAAGGISYVDRVRKLFPMAAEIGGHVGREQVVLYARVHRDHLQSFYPLFRDVLVAPDFPQADFERVRARALASLTQDLRGADDESLGKEVLQQMVFEHHPYGRPELGTETGLSQLKLADLRPHWQRILCKKRVYAALSGAVESDLQNQFAQDLGRLISETCSEPPTIPAPIIPNERRVWLVDKPEAASVAISMGLSIPVTRAHPDYPALTLIAAYLGQHRTFAGRLMQKMRADRSLNYGDYAYAEHFVQDGQSRFPRPNVGRHQQYFSVWLRPVRPEQAHFALRMAIRELESFGREGIGQADFERIRTFLARYLALYAQTAQERLGNGLDDLFYAVPGPYLDVLRAKVQNLTREDVNAAAKRHLDFGRLQIAMVAPAAQKLAAALIAGEPSPITYSSEKPREILEEDKLIASYPLGLQQDRITIIPLAKVFE